MINRIVHFALHQRILMLCAAGILLAWGLLSFFQLPIEAYPDVMNTQVQVITPWPGHAAQQEPEPGQRPLPPDIARGVLQAWRDSRIVKKDDGFYSADVNDPNGRLLSAIPEVRAWINLEMRPSEGAELMVDGVSGWFTPRNLPHRAWAYDPDDLNGLAAASTPTGRTPDNAVANAQSASDPALRPRITVRPDSWYPGTDRQADVGSIPTPESAAAQSDERSSPEKKGTSADVLEALHQATGLPIVADAYTRVYPQGTVSVRSQALFAGLNQLGDTMRLRWKKEGDWLQFRSMTFYEDRPKEVPNRLFSRWAAARRKQGFLTLDDLCEIAPLSEAQLAGADMAEGAQVPPGSDPNFDAAQLVFRESQIVPTQLFLAVVQMPGACNRRPLIVVSSHGMGFFPTWW